MTRHATALAATVLTALLGAYTVVAAGCGVGPGEAAEGEASLTVTRDYGHESLVTATLDGPTPSDTVVRFLDQEADIETDYGGNFVNTIEGLEGSTVAGGPEDWFFFVNGIYSEVGAGETQVHVGDRIWWDYRRWAEAYRVPAVVGSWPEPFLHGYDGEVRGVVVECVGGVGGAGGAGGAAEPCDEVAQRLRDAGVEPEVEEVAVPEPRPDDLRILVGAWDALRDDPAAEQLEHGPGTSGVYAQVQPCAGSDPILKVLDADAEPRRQLADWGLIAAVREGSDEPTWLVTASGEDRVEAVAGLLIEDQLRDRYAVALGADDAPLPVPVPDDAPDDADSPNSPNSQSARSTC